MDRRDFLKKTPLAVAIPLCISACADSSMLTKTSLGKAGVNRKAGTLSWLDAKQTQYQPGTTWGKPWPQGELNVDQSLCLMNADSQSVPLQSWPTAYWPDGSVKWTAHAIPANLSLGDSFSILKGQSAKCLHPVTVEQKSNEILVSTGLISCSVAKQGQHIISEMKRNGKLIAKNARLVGLVQDQAVNEPDLPAQVESFISQIEKVEVEQSGPVRAVIKVIGLHKRQSGGQWLPFTLRLYFYAGGETIKISHSFIYDGDDQKDFIRGLGLRFNVIQRDELYNRHVRFVGENNGLWSESPKGITGLRRDPGQAVKDAQVAGLATPPIKEWDERVSSRMHWIPTWQDFTLSQVNANGFEIKKRTKAGHAWIGADQGHRANGTSYLGGVTGGVVFGMRDFWQLHPVQIDIRDAGQDISEATLWFWAPEAPAMDVRFYHDGMGQDTYEKQLDALNITYEDYEPGFGSAYGVARTTDFTLTILDSTPSRQHMTAMAASIAKPDQIVAAPEDYLASGIFGGLWSLPDRSTPEKRIIEDRLSLLVDYYQKQIDQRHWYGFWNYGDIMHTYDADRHVWRYDIGGYAWDNSELSPDLWLWYSFLRTGDAGIFRMAENMTRHNRDVDIYHAGRFKGFGTRHNVQHWGDSAKQLRISSSAYRRFHYYITGDDRTGDVLNEMTNADEALGMLNATRKVAAPPPTPGLAKMGGGTDWSATAANWLTAWERTGDVKYKTRLENAMKVIGNHPQGFYAGAFAYDIKSKTLIPYPDKGPQFSHLSSVFGLIEINAELIQLIDVPEYKAAWLKYGRLYNASKSEQLAAIGQYKKGNLVVGHSRITANTAFHQSDAKLAKRAWKEFSKRWWVDEKLELTQVQGALVLNPVDEAAWVSTNSAAQWGLAAIQNLALIPEYLGK